MITRKEAQAYEKLAAAKQQSAQVKGKMYDALLDVLAPRKRASKTPPKIITGGKQERSAESSDR